MINILRSILVVVKIVFIICKYQIITKQDYIKVPYFIKVIIYILSLFFYPITIFRSPKRNFEERLSMSFIELGPIYIKMGQTLSTRPDLLGEPLAKQLQLLQDKLPPFDSKIVKYKIESSFKKKIFELFSYFEEVPIAAASIAQVHKAKLINGQDVAVKILRPKIYHQYNKDIVFFEILAKLISKLVKKSQRLKPIEVVSVFKETMKLELNLKSEAAAGSRLYDNFIGDSNIHIAKIYWNLTTKDILTLEWISGVSVYDSKKIREFKLDPKNIAQKIAYIFFNQAFRDGFFHADLHPGNIIVKNDGTISLIDFGIIGILSENDRLAIAEILYSFFERNYKRVAEIHHKAGFIPINTNLEYFAQSCRAIAEPILSLQVKKISIGILLSQLFMVTKEFGMETQPQLLLLQKTMVVVEGIIQSLIPNTNMLELTAPWLKSWANKNISLEAKILRFIKTILLKII